MKELGTKVAGVKMRTPVGVPATFLPVGKREYATKPEIFTKLLLKFIDAGAGYVYGVSAGFYFPVDMAEDLEKKYGVPSPPKGEARERFEKHGEQGIYYYVGPPITSVFRACISSDWIRKGKTFADRTHEPVFKEVKKKKPEDVALIANIGGVGAIPETWASSAKRYEELGADLIELNLSCPQPLTGIEAVEWYSKGEFPTFAGALPFDSPNAVKNVVKAVVDSVDIPVGPKFSPEVGFPLIVELAKSAKEAGAKFITLVNIGVSVAPPDIYNKGKTRWPYMVGNPIVAIGGDALRSRLYTDIFAVKKHVGLDIIATGGLMTPEHVVEAMMLGANATSQCTAIMYEGINLLKRDINFIKSFMEKEGYETVEDFIGISDIRSVDETEIKPAIAETDFSKCTGCGVCTDTFCIASFMEDGVAKVNPKICEGCGMCILTCKQGARKLVPAKHG